MTALLVVGCSKSKPIVYVKPPPKAAARAEIVSTNSSVEEYSPPPNRHRLWRVHWKTAKMEVKDEVPTVGVMDGVDGDIDDRSGIPKTFRADGAVIDHDSHVLTLTGNVVVTSSTDKSSLKCDKMVWKPNKNVLAASGNVSYQTPKYTIANVPEILANGDLSVIATPGLFKESDEKKS
jgi:hypothetical protein